MVWKLEEFSIIALSPAVSLALVAASGREKYRRSLSFNSIYREKMVFLFLVLKTLELNMPGKLTQFFPQYSYILGQF